MADYTYETDAGDEPKQKDNSTFDEKARLRKRLLDELDDPVVLESHGGTGRLYNECYKTKVDRGVVFELDESKADVLAAQRPQWAVYEADSEYAIGAGAGSHMACNFIDLDPYGQPWPVVEAFFESDRPKPDRLVFAVNDGLRQSLQMGRGWDVDTLKPVMGKWANVSLYDNYLDVCKHLLAYHADLCGYSLVSWGGYHCGHGNNMTHYGAVFEK